ncbi:MAG: sugar transferase [Caenibius sp.]
METDASPMSVEQRSIQNRPPTRQEPSAFNFLRHQGGEDELHVVHFKRQSVPTTSTVVAVEEPRVQRSVESLDHLPGDGLNRWRDVIGSCILLAVLAPVLILVAIAIKLTCGGPILFKQTRVGRFGKEFACIKFRTMLIDSDERLRKLLDENPAARQEWLSSHKLENDPRITWLGTFLRFSSIDELPQLWNVLRGDMSLVGPRPVVAEELEKYGRYGRYYKHVLPGLTGLWQVSGRSTTTYRRRIALDVTYVKNRSSLLDLRILLATIPEILMARGAY